MDEILRRRRALMTQGEKKNGLEDGTYTVQGCTITVQNNVITETAHANYKTINVPFKTPIAISSGDVVVFSSDNFDNYNITAAVPIGFNADYYSQGGSYTPIKTPVGNKTVTMTESFTATSLRIQIPSNTYLNKSFRFILKINGEDVI